MSFRENFQHFQTHALLPFFKVFFMSRVHSVSNNSILMAVYSWGATPSPSARSWSIHALEKDSCLRLLLGYTPPWQSKMKFETHLFEKGSHLHLAFMTLGVPAVDFPGCILLGFPGIGTPICCYQRRKVRKSLTITPLENSLSLAYLCYKWLILLW